MICDTVTPPGLPARSAAAMVLSAKLRVFRIVFSEPDRAFYSSGDKLSGSVQLEAAQPCTLSGLRVTAAGCARVAHCGGKKRGRSPEVEYLKYEEQVRLEEALSPGEAPRSGREEQSGYIFSDKYNK